MDNKNEKILEDINKWQGYKVTYQYATAINIKDNNMNPWFEKIEEILLNVKGVIRILSPDNPQVNYDYWVLPGKYKRHTKEYHEKLEKFLEKFATNVNINEGLIKKIYMDTNIKNIYSLHILKLLMITL